MATDPALPLQAVYQRLLDHFGPQHWWPAQSPFEVAVGAILTQNTAWTNVERAIANLRAADALAPQALRSLTPETLGQLIRPAGFFRQKALRLQLLCNYLRDRHADDPAGLRALPLETARAELLALHGIGPETADAILLYAAGLPSFVVDAYTRRIFGRLGLLAGTEDYATIRRRFMCALPGEAALFNEYHALIVALAKACCRKRQPACGDCPLRDLCRHGCQQLSSRGKTASMVC